MRLYPAIDIQGGKCVRLERGVFTKSTVYGDDPARMARKWESQGAQYIHVVDLDGAQKGKGVNNKVIEQMVKSVSIPIQLGGGIRTIKDIDDKLSLGVARVILGTVAIENPKLVQEAIKKYGNEKIVVGVDAKNGKVAIHGWETVSSKEAVDVCLEMKLYGVRTIIYTDIAQDGMMQGPNLKSTKELVEKTELNIIASGGVSTLDDLIGAKNIGCEGAIIGRALYIDAIDLKEALKITS